MGRFSVPLIKEQKGIIFMNAIRRTPACRHDRPALAFLYLPKHHRRQVTLKKKKKWRDYNLSILTQSRLQSFRLRAVSLNFKIIWLLFLFPLHLKCHKVMCSLKRRVAVCVCVRSAAWTQWKYLWPYRDVMVWTESYMDRDRRRQPDRKLNG